MGRRLERRADGWFVVTDTDGGLYGPTAVTATRKRVCGPDVPRGNAESAAVGLGLIAKAEIEETERGNGYGV